MNDKLDVKPDEKSLLLDHNYDGIQELNHPLPRWWNFIFYTAIIYSIGYAIYYHGMGGPNLKQEFEKDYAVIAKKQEEYKKANQAFRPEVFASLNNAEGLKKGEEVFELNCVPCHADKGQGDVGPNLTDKHWLLANGNPESIYNVVFNGSEANGMPIWSELISQEDIYLATVYVSSIKNTFQKGKKPEGKLIEE